MMKQWHDMLYLLGKKQTTVIVLNLWYQIVNIK